MSHNVCLSICVDKVYLFNHSLFPGRVDIRGLGGSAARGEGDPGEKLWSEDEAELHQEHLHSYWVREEATSVNKISVEENVLLMFI